MAKPNTKPATKIIAANDFTVQLLGTLNEDGTVVEKGAFDQMLEIADSLARAVADKKHFSGTLADLAKLAVGIDKGIKAVISTVKPGVVYTAMLENFFIDELTKATAVAKEETERIIADTKTNAKEREKASELLPYLSKPWNDKSRGVVLTILRKGVFGGREVMMASQNNKSEESLYMTRLHTGLRRAAMEAGYIFVPEPKELSEAAKIRIKIVKLEKEIESLAAEAMANELRGMLLSKLKDVEVNLLGK